MLLAIALATGVSSQEIARGIKFSNKTIEKVDKHLRESNSLNSTANKQAFFFNKKGRRSQIEPISCIEGENLPFTHKKLKGSYYYLLYEKGVLVELDRLIFSEGGKL